MAAETETAACAADVATLWLTRAWWQPHLRDYPTRLSSLRAGGPGLFPIVISTLLKQTALVRQENLQRKNSNGRARPQNWLRLRRETAFPTFSIGWRVGRRRSFDSLRLTFHLHRSEILLQIKRKAEVRTAVSPETAFRRSLLFFRTLYAVNNARADGVSYKC